MRTLVILGTWGKDGAPSHAGLTRLTKGETANVFNGGSYDRLKGIMTAADAYDKIVWNPRFEQGFRPIRPQDFIGDAAVRVCPA